MIRKDRKSKLRTNAYGHAPIARAFASTIALIAILTAGACSPSTIAQAQEGPTATVQAGDTAELSVVTPAPPVSGATGTTETTVEAGPTQDVAGERTSELIPAGDTFDTYANHALGFSILVPREMVITFGDCTWNEANGDHSYRPAAAPVPTAIFEEDDTVILTFASYHALTGQSLERQEDGGTRSFYANCVPMTNTLALATDTDPDNPYRAAWSIRVVDIEGQEELESFVKTRYGRGCSVGEMTPSPDGPAHCRCDPRGRRQGPGVYRVPGQLPDSAQVRPASRQARRLGCGPGLYVRRRSGLHDRLRRHHDRELPLHRLIPSVRRAAQAEPPYAPLSPWMQGHPPGRPTAMRTPHFPGQPRPPLSAPVAKAPSRRIRSRL